MIHNIKQFEDNPDNYPNLRNFVTFFTPEYLELTVPIKMGEYFDMKHPTFTKFFTSFQVEDNSGYCSLEIKEYIPPSKAVIKLFFRPELSVFIFGLKSKHFKNFYS